ncbi:MAG: hypothetical protein JST54_12085 [Deltaproteobacteria bacterium]|nr:hypothetical protein [Deltaproteobacteria bacterium]
MHELAASVDAGGPDAGEPLARNRDLLGRARALLRDNKQKEAVGLLLEAQKTLPNDCETILTLAEAQARGGDFKTALATHRSFVDLKCDSVPRSSALAPG